MKISKPDMSNVWAEGGSVAVVPSEKISQGWVVEIPPCEQMNFVQNRQDAGIAYMLQQGIPEWDSSTEYQSTSYIQKDGVVYRAVGVNTNKPPTTFPDFWERAFDDAGSAQVVQDQIDAIEADPNPFGQYLLKTRATANGIDANLILTNKLEMVNLNIVDAVGEYYIDATCTNKPFSAGLMKVWVEAAGFATYQLVQSFKGEGIATRVRDNATDWSIWKYSVTSDVAVDLSTLQNQITALQSSLVAINEATKIKVGDMFLTLINFLAPSEVTTHLGYGTWVRAGAGCALVSMSDVPTHPAWTKRFFDVYGEYTHSLTVDEMPNHSHGVPSNGEAGVNYATLAAGDRTSSDGLTSTTAVGGWSAHNNVQPSIVVGVWYRTA